MGWNIDGKPVSSVDMYEGRVIATASHFRAWRVTGPGKDNRTEVECKDLAQAREMVTLDAEKVRTAGSPDRLLVYAVAPSGSQVLVTKRNLQVMDVQIEEEKKDPPPPAPVPVDNTEYKCLAVLPSGLLLKFRKLHDALSHRDVPASARIWGRPADFVTNADMDEVAALVKSYLPGESEMDHSPEGKRAVYYALLGKALTPEQAAVSRENTQENDMATKKKASMKKAKAPKAPKANGEKRTYTRINAESKITLLVDKNPKRQGSESYKRFEKYSNGLTVAEFLKKGGKSADISYDVAHGYISLS